MELGLEKLQHAHAGDIMHKGGVAFFNSALEDAPTFCSETSPDHRRMPTIVNWYILLSIALLGPKVSIDLEELKVKYFEVQNMLILIWLRRMPSISWTPPVKSVGSSAFPKPRLSFVSPES